MKEIKAYIKEHRLDVDTLALHHVDGLTGMSVSEVRGFGRGKSESSGWHPDRKSPSDFVPHVKIEIVGRDHLVDQIIEVIKETAHTGLRSDGKIYVSEVNYAIRIQTEESGEDTV